MRLPSRLPLLAAFLLLLQPGPAAAAPDTRIDFDTLANGEAVGDQYTNWESTGRGVTFRSSDNPPRAVAGPSASAPNAVDVCAAGSGEFCSGSIRVDFSDPRTRVSMRVGTRRPGTDAQVTVTAYGTGGEVDTASAVGSTTPGGCQWCTVELEAGDPADFGQLITHFTIRARPGGAIDDLVFERPDAPRRGWALEWSRTIDDGAAADAVGLRPGFSTRTRIDVKRFGGSTGTVAFTAEGLPEGVTASFDPASTSGSSTTLTLTAADRAAPADATVVVRATDPSPDAGVAGNPRVDLPVGLRPNFAVAGDPRVAEVPAPTIDVRACTAGGGRGSLPVFVPKAFFSPDPGRNPQRFFGPVAVEASGVPSGVALTPATAELRLVNAAQELPIEVTAPHGALTRPTHVSFRARRTPYEDSTGKVLLRPVPGVIEAVSPSRGRAPEFMRPGTEVVLRGVGLCSTTGVEFGHEGAVAKPHVISPDGRELRVHVPRRATSGPLVLRTPFDDAGASRSPGHFAVSSFRSTRGFAFENYNLPNLSFDDVTALFGEHQTYLRHRPDPLCPPGMPRKLCPPRPKLPEVKVPNPLALIFTGIAKRALTGSKPHNAHCFGMAVLSQRLASGTVPLSAFHPTGAKDVWGLEAARAPSPRLDDALRVQHIGQLGLGFLLTFAAQAAANTVLGDPSREVATRVEQALKRNDPALVVMRKGNAGHIVVAYDVAPGPGAGERTIHVYDPNTPFTAAERTDGAQHAIREGASEIRLTADGRWSFAPLSYGGKIASLSDALVVVPAGDVPAVPALPTDPARAITTGFGSGRVAQVSDGRGRVLLAPDGSPNEDVATRLATAATIPTLDGDAEAPDTTVLLTERGRFVHTVRGEGRGAYRWSAVAGGLAAGVRTTAAGTSTTDEVVLDTEAGAVGLRTRDARKAAELTLSAQLGGGTVRTALVRTTAARGGSDRVAFDRARGALSLTHTGAPAVATVTLSAAGARAGADAAGTVRLRLGRGDRVLLRPSWGRLSAGAWKATIRRRDGRTTRRTIVAKRPRTAARITVGRISAGRGPRSAVAVPVRARGIHGSTQVVVAGLLVQGRRVVRRAVVQLAAAEAARGRRVVLAGLGRPRPGQRLVVTAAGVSSGERPVVVQATRSLRAGAR